MKKKLPIKVTSKTGEIATFVTLVTFFVIGLTSLISTIALKKPQTTQTKAAASCDDPNWNCADECAPQSVRDIFNGTYGANGAQTWRNQKAANCGIDPSQCSATNVCGPAGVPTIPPSSAGVSCDSNDWSCGGECASQAVRDTFSGVYGANAATKWRQEKAKNCGITADQCTTVSICGSSPSTSTDLCQCINGKPNDPNICGDANPCGAQSGNSGSCNYGQWKSDCTGSNGNCPADAGVTYTYWCDKDGIWRFQYPNCVTWCKPDYLKQAPNPAGICSGKAPGTELPGYTDNVPSYTKKGSDIGVTFPFVACDKNQGIYVEVRAFCDEFGQAQWGPAKRTNVLCGGATQPKPQNYTIPKEWQVAPPTPTLKLTPIIFSPLSSTPSPGRPGPTVTVQSYCPDAQGPSKAICAPTRPTGYVETYLSCISWQDKCWVPSSDIAAYPTPVLDTKTIEIDDGFSSWSKWITNTQVCDDVGQKSFLGINGILVKNCRSPEYLPSTRPGKVILKYQQKRGIKTILCTLGGVGRCINLP